MSMRYNWNTPFFLSPHNPSVVYFAGNRVLKSMKRGDDLQLISPDLTKKLDGQDRHVRCVSPAASRSTPPAPRRTARSWRSRRARSSRGCSIAGTDDGNVWKTSNDGATWENLTGEARADAAERRRSVRHARRSIVARHVHVLRRLRQSPLGRLQAVPVRDQRRRPQLPSIVEQPADGRTGRLPARGARGSAQSRPAVRGHVDRRVRLDRPRRHVDALHDGTAERAGVRSQDPSARPRAHRGHARSQLLDRRHRAARADDAEGDGRRRAPLRAEARLPVGRSTARSAPAATATRRRSSPRPTRSYGASDHVSRWHGPTGNARIIIVDALGDTIAAPARDPRVPVCTR